MAEGFDWGSLAQKGMDYFGVAGAARGQASESKRAAEEEQRRYEAEQDKYNARKRAYESMLGQAGSDFKTGEGQFMTEANTANPELATMQNQINTQGAQALQDTAGQINLANTQAGARGGQAATQLRRGIGEVGANVQKDVNKLKFDESAQRAGERRAYTASKARAGQAATYMPPIF